MKGLFFCCLITCVVLFSCNSDLTSEDNLNPQEELSQETSTSELPEVNNGILKFKDDESLRFWLDKTSQMTNEQFFEWENTMGFKSFFTVFDKLVDDENRASDSLTNIFIKSRLNAREAPSSATYPQ